MVRVLFTLFRRLKVVRAKAFLKVLVLTLAILLYATTGFLFFELEHKPDLSWADAAWWSIVTMTTVGYGDFFPTSAGGRFLVGVPVMIFGISVLGYVLSTVATFLIEARSRERKGMSNLTLEDHLLIIHAPSPQRVLGLLAELQQDDKTKDAPVVLIDDRLEELPERLKDAGVRFVAGDPTKEGVLERASFRRAKSAILLSRSPQDPRSDDHNLAVALTLEQLCPQIHTVAECLDPDRVELLKKAGCDSVVCLAQMSSALLVTEVADPGLEELFRDLASNEGGHQLYLVPVTGLAAYAEVQAGLAEQGALALGVRRSGHLHLNPKPAFPLEPGDLAVCLGEGRPRALDRG